MILCLEVDVRHIIYPSRQRYLGTRLYPPHPALSHGSGHELRLWRGLGDGEARALKSQDKPTTSDQSRASRLLDIRKCFALYLRAVEPPRGDLTPLDPATTSISTAVHLRYAFSISILQPANWNFKLLHNLRVQPRSSMNRFELFI